MAASSREELLKLVAKLSKKSLAITTVTRQEAAAFLEVSVRTLENRARKGEPPPPAASNPGGIRGKVVKYRLSTLVEFCSSDGFANTAEIQDHASRVAGTDADGQAIEDEKARTVQAAKPHVVLASSLFGSHGPRYSDLRAHVAKWATTVDPAVSEDAEFPFFVNEQGLVLGPAWQSVQQTFDWFMAPDTDVTFQTWVRGLAMVWVNESDRLAAINDCAKDVPEVPDLVAQLRKQQLAAI